MIKTGLVKYADGLYKFININNNIFSTAFSFINVHTNYKFVNYCCTNK